MRSLIGSLWWVIILLCVVIAGWAWYHQRPVVSWFPASTAQVVDAKPGDIATIQFRFDKIRQLCRLNTQINTLWLVDSTGQSFSVNQRSGMPAEVSGGIGLSVLRFEVPRFAHPGRAQVYLRGGFDCDDALGKTWTIRHVSPRYTVEVKSSDGE